MIEVTTIGRHADSQALGEVCHHLVDVFLWQLFPGGRQSDFQLINQLEFMVLFQHGTPDVIVPRVQIWRVWGTMILMNEPRTVRLCDMHHVSWGAILMEDEALTACVTDNDSHFEHLQ